MTTEPKPRGICPVCGAEKQLTKSGGMRDHLGDARIAGWRQQCYGVGQPAASLVADPLVAAKAAGWREAIEALRDRERYAAWDLAQVEPRTPLSAVHRDVAADYLETLTDG